MKTVFHRYGSIVEPDIIDAFTAIGIDVIEESMEIEKKAIDSDTRISVMAESILVNRPDFVFSINYFPYISAICQKLNTIYIALSVDCPVIEIYSETVRNSCNRIFLFDRQQYESIKDMNPEGVFYIPLATNVERWDAIEHGDYKYDVSFVGSLYSEKNLYPKLRLTDLDRGYFDALLKAQELFGGLLLLDEAIAPDNKYLLSAIRDNADTFERFELNALEGFDTNRFAMINNILGFDLSWKDRINLLESISIAGTRVDLFTRSVHDFSNENVILHQGVSTHKEMPLVFKESKINLNHTMRSIRTGIPQRIWDIAGCGGFVLTNYQAELPSFFEIGVDIAAYENTAECIELIEYYLSHEDEREAMAHNAYTKVKNMHTYVIRMAQILTTVFK